MSISFKVADYIGTQSDDGTVTKITIMYTSLITEDNKVITIPNGMLTNASIKNYSAEEKRRVDFVFSASYDGDVAQVKAILLNVLSAHAKVLNEPAPFARLSKHADSALEYTSRVWYKSEDYWDVYFDITERVQVAFNENNISIPYP